MLRAAQLERDAKTLREENQSLHAFADVITNVSPRAVIKLSGYNHSSQAGEDLMAYANTLQHALSDAEGMLAAVKIDNENLKSDAQAAMAETQRLANTLAAVCSRDSFTPAT